jgi:multicomponent Na+:H+ antiporter subunit F
MIGLIYVVLVGAAACFGFRLARGPSLADRALALDGLLITGVAAIATNAMQTGHGAFLPVAVAVTLVGFISTAIVARYIEGRGS